MLGRGARPGPPPASGRGGATLTVAAAAPRLRSHWFVPAHHDVHSQYPDRVAELLAAQVRGGFFA